MPLPAPPGPGASPALAPPRTSPQQQQQQQQQQLVSHPLHQQQQSQQQLPRRQGSLTSSPCGSQAGPSARSCTEERTGLDGGSARPPSSARPPHQHPHQHQQHRSYQQAPYLQALPQHKGLHGLAVLQPGQSDGGTGLGRANPGMGGAGGGSGGSPSPALTLQERLGSTSTGSANSCGTEGSAGSVKSRGKGHRKKQQQQQQQQQQGGIQHQPVSQGQGPSPQQLSQQHQQQQQQQKGDEQKERERRAEKKRRRLEKALATANAIRSELEKKKQRRKEEEQRLFSEGAALAESVALTVLVEEGEEEGEDEEEEDGEEEEEEGARVDEEDVEAAEDTGDETSAADEQAVKHANVPNVHATRLDTGTKGAHGGGTRLQIGALRACSPRAHGEGAEADLGVVSRGPRASLGRAKQSMGVAGEVEAAGEAGVALSASPSTADGAVLQAGEDSSDAFHFGTWESAEGAFGLSAAASAARSGHDEAEQMGRATEPGDEEEVEEEREEDDEEEEEEAEEEDDDADVARSHQSEKLAGGRRPPRANSRGPSPGLSTTGRHGAPPRPGSRGAGQGQGGGDNEEDGVNQLLAVDPSLEVQGLGALTMGTLVGAQERRGRGERDRSDVEREERGVCDRKGAEEPGGHGVGPDSEEDGGRAEPELALPDFQKLATGEVESEEERDGAGGRSSSRAKQGRMGRERGSARWGEEEGHASEGSVAGSPLEGLGKASASSAKAGRRAGTAAKGAVPRPVKAAGPDAPAVAGEFSSGSAEQEPRARKKEFRSQEWQVHASSVPAGSDGMNPRASSPPRQMRPSLLDSQQQEGPQQLRRSLQAALQPRQQQQQQQQQQQGRAAEALLGGQQEQIQRLQLKQERRAGESEDDMEPHHAHKQQRQLDSEEMLLEQQEQIRRLELELRPRHTVAQNKRGSPGDQPGLGTMYAQREAPKGKLRWNPGLGRSEGEEPQMMALHLTIQEPDLHLLHIQQHPSPEHRRSMLQQQQQHPKPGALVHPERSESHRPMLQRPQEALPRQQEQQQWQQLSGLRKYSPIASEVSFDPGPRQEPGPAAGLFQQGTAEHRDRKASALGSFRNSPVPPALTGASGGMSQPSLRARGTSRNGPFSSGVVEARAMVGAGGLARALLPALPGAGATMAVAGDAALPMDIVTDAEVKARVSDQKAREAELAAGLAAVQAVAAMRIAEEAKAEAEAAKRAAEEAVRAARDRCRTNEPGGEGSGGGGGLRMGLTGIGAMTLDEAGSRAEPMAVDEDREELKAKLHETERQLREKSARVSELEHNLDEMTQYLRNLKAMIEGSRLDYLSLPGAQQPDGPSGPSNHQ